MAEERQLELFPELPYIREQLGLRFAGTTIEAHWRKIITVRVFPLLPNSFPLRDYRLLAVKWILAALDAASQVSNPVILNDPPMVHLRLSQMYSLDGQWQAADRSWHTFCSSWTANPNRMALGPQDWATLLANAPSGETVRQRMEDVGEKPVAFEDAPFGVANDTFIWMLAICRTAPNREGGLQHPVVCQLAPGPQPDAWRLTMYMPEPHPMDATTTDHLTSLLHEQLERIVTVWTPWEPVAGSGAEESL